MKFLGCVGLAVGVIALLCLFPFLWWVLVILIALAILNESI